MDVTVDAPARAAIPPGTVPGGDRLRDPRIAARHREWRPSWRACCRLCTSSKSRGRNWTLGTRWGPRTGGIRVVTWPDSKPNVIPRPLSKCTHGYTCDKTAKTGCGSPASTYRLMMLVRHRSVFYHEFALPLELCGPAHGFSFPLLVRRHRSGLIRYCCGRSDRGADRQPDKELAASPRAREQPRRGGSTGPSCWAITAADMGREASVCNGTNKYDIRFGPATAITRLYEGPPHEG